MKKVLLLPIALLLAGAGTAAAQDVRYNFDSQANFASFKTYKWVTIKGAQKLPDLAERQVMAALDAELSKKGLMKSDSDGADLYIGYQAAVSQEKEYTSFDTGWGAGPAYGRGWYGAGGGMTTGLVTMGDGVGVICQQRPFGCRARRSPRREGSAWRYHM